MAYVITEPCIGTKDAACVDVCPVDCIHPRKDEPDFEQETMLYIDPDVCIDCGACEPACPVSAIFQTDLVPEKWLSYIKRAQEYFKSPAKLEEERIWLEGYRARQQELEEERARDPKWQRKVALQKKLEGFSSTLPRDYWYLNEAQIDSLYSQIMGHLVTQVKHQKQKARSKTGSIRATLGNVLAVLGIGSLGADLTAASSAQEADEITAVLTTANRLNIVYEYFRAEDEVEVVSDGRSVGHDGRTMRRAIYLTDNSQLCDFDGVPVPKDDRREFFRTRSYMATPDQEGRFDVMSRGASLVSTLDGRKVIVPFFFADVKFSGKGSMYGFNEVIRRPEKRFPLSMFGVVSSSDTERIVVTPLAMWSSELRRLMW
jgi:NAD-dependent dihydropyrimidine dehydrogenase PreA subunit